MDARDLIPLYNYRETTKADVNCSNCRHSTFSPRPKAMVPFNSLLIYCKEFTYDIDYRPTNDRMICDIYK